MYLMIDNYDSFVYNLKAYIDELNEDVMVIRNDKLTIKEIAKMKNLRGIIISPGPKSPKDCGICTEVVRKFSGKIPILGVCLGHQIIGYEFGATVEKGEKPMHGKVSKIFHNKSNLFKNLESSYVVTRYHSLVIKEETIPEELTVDARSEDDAVMAISHKEYPVYGVQFHPEAVLTQYGHEILKNFIDLSEEWWNNHE
ncbi:anthranilate synthase component II [Clostridium butyricum]|uniref:anthranilate synthase component II n=1 Tax=Clostridium butyricum TaxID=1492 RepID=UPI0002C92F37|nr:aminodeoxychorismate/anthranilate synthase component II [Clostridium butyricum]EMU53850.1 anthranilate synthase component II [Clostridium butyricum DKU-01]